MFYIGIAMMIALFGAYIVIRRTKLGKDVDQGLEEGYGHVETAAAWLHKQFRKMRPRIMRLGWIAVFLIGGSALSVFLAGTISHAPDSPFATPVWPIFLVLPVSVLCGLGIWNTIRQPEDEQSIIGLMVMSSFGLMVSGFVTVVCAAFAHSMTLAMIGGTELMGGAFLLWQFCRLLAGFGVKVVDVSEGIGGALSRLAKIIAQAFDNAKLADVIGTGPNIADQELFVSHVDRIFKPFISMLAAIVAVTILKPHELALLGVSVAGFVSELVWFRLDARGVDTWWRRVRSVLFFEALIVLLLVLFLGKLIEIQYGGDESSKVGRTVHAVWNESEIIFAKFLSRFHWIALAATCALAAWITPGFFPRESTTMRKIVRTIAALGILGCLGVFVGGFIVTEVRNDGSVATVIGDFRIGFTPKVSVTKTPSVVVGWGSAGPDTSSVTFTVERRTPEQPTFTSLVMLSSGTTTWEDTTVTRGRTYFYRVIVRDGQKEIRSNEVSVRIPDTSVVVITESPGTKQTPAVNTQPVAEKREVAEGCRSGNCGRNPSLSELCQRHPNVAGCR